MDTNCSEHCCPSIRAEEQSRTHSMPPAHSAFASSARPFQRQRFTHAPVLRRHSPSPHCGSNSGTTGTTRRDASDASITQDMLSGILHAFPRDALGIMRSCMPGSLLRNAASNAPHTAITRTRFQNAHGSQIAHTEVTLGRKNKMKNE